MGATASVTSSPNAEDRDNVHFYDAFRQMKLEKMSDEEIYAALKQKYSHLGKGRGRIQSRNTNGGSGNDSLRNVALNHFSQTLETNRIGFEKSKRVPLLHSASCNLLLVDNSDGKESTVHPLHPHGGENSEMKENKEMSELPTTTQEDVAVQNTTSAMESDSIAMSLSPSKKVMAKPSKRPQLTVFVDTNAEDEEDDGTGGGGGGNQIENVRTPRVQGRISPGAVHVGKFAINEQGLRSEVTGRECPHAFLTAGKSDFVEIGFLGSGASSSIIEALHIPTLTIVALKMLPAKDSSDLQCISSELSVLYRNLAELRLIDVRLDEEECSDDEEKPNNRKQSNPCPQVLALYDAFLDAKNGMVNLVVEYMDGGSLQDLVDRGGCKDEQVLADIAHQGLLGLAFLHGQNCIHRDIKPGNILVNCAGIVKIADFGVAKAMDINFEMNKEASFVGTMCYMAPERMRSETYGVSADVWSFGLTLLAVVLGKYPLLESHEKSNYWDLMRVICDETPPKLSKKFSKHLHSFINSCLRKAPDERASVKDLLRSPFVQDLDLPMSDTQQHAPLSLFTVQSQQSKMESVDAVTTEGSDAMLVKFAHLETVLEKTEVKYQHMVELWKKQGNLGFSANNDDSYRSISARSISMKSPAEPMTRLPNFVTGLEQWKHLAAQLRLPLDIVLSTAASIINRKYFSKI